MHSRGRDKCFLKKSLANLAEASQKATGTIDEFNEFIAAMIDTSEELSKTTAQLRLILEKVNSGQGTAAKFLNDGRFYENMLENAHQMQILLEELKLFVSEAREKGLRIKMK